MPILPPQPPIVWQKNTPAPSVEEVGVEASDALTGHREAMAEAARRWPGQIIHVVSEGLDERGRFHMTCSHESPPSNLMAGSPPPSTDVEAGTPSDGISDPKAVIFLTGDGKGFGSMPPKPPAPGRPIIVATRGDSEDHRIMDSRWQSALDGHDLLWSPRLTWKYRTATVVFRNAVDGHTIMEQGQSAIDCGSTGDDPRQAVMRCLSDSPDADDLSHGTPPQTDVPH